MRLRSIVIVAIALSAILADDPVHSCPKYTCEKGTETSCVNVKSGLKTDGFNKISLTEICKKGEEYCDVPFPSYKTLSDVSTDTAYTCKAFGDPKNWKFRYPGENCDKDGDCIKVDDNTPTCVSGYCSGVAEGKACKSTSSCVVGLYCDKKSNTCVKQKSEGDCTESTDCVNHLLCHKGKCSLTPYSLDIGTEIDKEDINFHGFKCKLSDYDLDFKCVSLVQEETGDKDGFVECKYGETCKYKMGEHESTKPCACGFNSDGKGYCPLGFNKREELLTKAYTKMASLFKNTCHSVSRAFCYQKTGTAQGFALDFINFDKAHLLHNAVPCADSVLSGNFVSFSTMAVVLLISLLI
jgi:hypothetical protein